MTSLKLHNASQPFQLQLSLRSTAAMPFPISLEGALLVPQDLPHPVEVHLMRHGESASNARKLITGATNVPLTRRGKLQARQAGRKLARHYDAAFSSTLYRSIQTMALALKEGNVAVDQVFRETCLDERSLGELELQPSRPISHYAAGDFLYAPGGGESYASVTRRSLSFLAGMAGWIGNEWTERGRKIERVLICSHMGPMRILAAILNEDTSPSLVLARSFDPADMKRYFWRRLVGPKFHLDDEL